MMFSSELHRLRTSIANHYMMEEKISSKSIGWHIQHSLTLINEVCEQLQKSDTTEYNWHINPLFIMHQLRGTIPRGKTSSNEDYIPVEEADSQELLVMLEIAISNLKAAQCLAPNHWYKHSLYGSLNLKQSLNFLKLHTLHHLKIIDEIEYECIYSHQLIETQD